MGFIEQGQAEPTLFVVDKALSSHFETEALCSAGRAVETCRKLQCQGGVVHMCFKLWHVHGWRLSCMVFSGGNVEFEGQVA